jgi:predicted hydrocarbon binding protein
MKYMEQVITKQEFDELMSIDGETRGAGLTDGYEFFEREVGKEKANEGIVIIEKRITELGYPFKFSEIKPMTFYPVGLLAVILVLMQRIYSLTNEKLQEIGHNASKVSLIVRLFMRHFFSLDMMVKKSPDIWRKYFTVGDLTVHEYDKKKRYMIFRIKNFRLHPFHCEISKGYLANTTGMVVNSKVTVEETKCVYRGDEYHEFLMKW